MNRPKAFKILTSLDVSVDARLAWCALTMLADDSGEAKAPPQVLFAAIRIKGQRLQHALIELVWSGHVSLIEGRPHIFQLHEKSAPANTPRPKLASPPVESLNSDSVARVVAAARIPHDPMRPLYWRQASHISDLRALLNRLDCGLDQLCHLLANEPPAGSVRRIVSFLPGRDRA